MDINHLLNYEFSSTRFDEINEYNVNHLDINSLFKLEYNLINNIYKMENKCKDLDIIFLNYNNFKKNIQSKVKSSKDILSKISIQKEELENLDSKRKLLYLTKEYNNYLIQTNTKELVKKIKSLEQRIDLIKKQVKDKKLSSEYNRIKKNYNKIIIFINGEKFDHKNDVIPNNLNIDEKIKWFENRISEAIEKKMIFDSYLFLLESFYDDILNKRMLDIAFN